MSEKKKNSKKTPENKSAIAWNVTRKVLKSALVVLRIAFGAAVTVLLICIVCGFVFLGTLGDYLQEDILPAADLSLDTFDLDQTSYLYYVDSGGKIQQLQQVFATTNSQWASLEDIPDDLIHAAVAIEDKRFFEHQGVDWFTTIKACARMFFGDSSVGGSSITQQTIKNLLLSEDSTADDVTVQRKVIEIFRAAQLEKKYDKDKIMEYYLNIIYLGKGCRGVRSAAETYFGKELEMLTTAECASLISITNNPSIYNPYRGAFEEGGKTGAERNRERQLTVLSEMEKQGWITKQEYDAAVAQEMVFKKGIDPENMLSVCPSCGNKTIVANLVSNGGKHYCVNCGAETEIANNASQSVYSWFVDTVLEDVAMALAEKDGVEWNASVKEIYMAQIRRAGYRIYTTLDMKVQNEIDKIYTDLTQIPATRSGQQLQSAIVVVDNRTGDIVGMSGGVGEKEDFDAFNRATDSKLQSGSSIKPLSVYAPAFETGKVSPATVVSDLPFTYTDGAWPKNDDLSYSYSRTVFSAIVNSVNAAATYTLDKIGVNYAYDFAKNKFKLSTLYEEYKTNSGGVQTDIGYAPLALGAQVKGVTVRDMTCAFATFANKGVYRQGRTFTKVYDINGNLVLDNTQKSETLLKEKTVTYINYCLTAAVNSGTGGGARLGSTAVAGKTGSTSKYKDRWFCGYTGYYTAAVWCGYDTPEQIILTNSTGNPASRLWNKVMTPLHQGKAWQNLYSTANLKGVSVCLDSGMIATDACKADVRTVSRVDTVSVYPGDGPTKTCTKHVMVDYCKEGKGVANKYCIQLAEADAGVTLEKRSLVKMTQDEITAIQRAKSNGLSGEFLRDDYVYLVDKNGNDASFKGFSGNANSGVDAPYVVCKLHTQADVDKMHQNGSGTEEVD